MEAALSIYLESFATTLGTREQLAISEFAQVPCWRAAPRCAPRPLLAVALPRPLAPHPVMLGRSRTCSTTHVHTRSCVCSARLY